MTFFFFFLLIFQNAYSFQNQDLDRLYKKYDHDHDKKITIDDKIRKSEVFVAGKLKARGMYQISVLAQELALNGKADKKVLLENPVERTSRLIREVYWDGLTRRIDPDTV